MHAPAPYRPIHIDAAVNAAARIIVHVCASNVRVLREYILNLNVIVPVR